MAYHYTSKSMDPLVLSKESFVCGRWHGEPQLVKVKRIRDAESSTLILTYVLNPSVQGIGITEEEGTEVVVDDCKSMVSSGYRRANAHMT